MPNSSNAGLYHRRYDSISETQSKQSFEEINAVLAWSHGIDVANDTAEEKKGIYSKAKNSIKNLFSGRHIQTSLLTLGATVVGAGIGIALGTFVLPGIGSAIGGTVGGLVAGAVGTLGGGIGLGTLGAGFGAWIGPKISKKIFKTEQINLSHGQVGNLAKLGIDNETADLMNEYLKNRELSVTSPSCKKAYHDLRQEGIHHANAERLNDVAQFFCHELVLLKQEIEVDKPNNDLLNEISTVKNILDNLARAYKLSYEARNKIQQILLDVDRHPPVVTAPIAEPTLLPESNVIPLLSPSSTSTDISQKPRQKVVQFSAKPQKNEEKGVATLTDEQLHKLVDECKAYLYKAPDAVLTVVAQQDDTLATRLMAQALTQGLKPQLAPEEYPDNTPEAKARKQKIIADAYQLANLSQEPKKSPVGFKMETPNPFKGN